MIVLIPAQTPHLLTLFIILKFVMFTGNTSFCAGIAVSKCVHEEVSSIISGLF